MKKGILFLSAIAFGCIACSETENDIDDAKVRISVEMVSQITDSRASAALPTSFYIAWSGRQNGQYAFTNSSDTYFREQTLRPGDYEFIAYNLEAENEAYPIDSKGEAYYKSDVVAGTIESGVNDIALVAKVANAQVNITFDNTLTSIVSDYIATAFTENNPDRKLTFSESDNIGAWFAAGEKIMLSIQYFYGGETKSFDLTLPTEIKIGDVTENFDGTLKAGNAYTFNIGSSVADGMLNVTINSTLSDANGFVTVDPTIDPEI